MNAFDSRDPRLDAGCPDAGRRRALGCLASWTGAAALWNVSGGVPRALGMTAGSTLQAAPPHSLTFVQISDTHIGFNKAANPDVVGSLRLGLPTSTPCRTGRLSP